MLEPLADHVWTVGHDFTSMGLHFPGRMTVIRLPTGKLWLHSPIPIDDELAAELAKLGPVGHLVGPNRFHHVHLGPARQRYPDARMYAAPGLSSKRKDLSFDERLSDEPPVEWSGAIETIALLAAPALGEVVFFHRPSGTLITTDLFMNVHEARGVFSRLMYRAEGCWRRPRVPRIMGLVARGDKERMRADAARMAALPVKQVVMAHGELITDGASAFVREELGRAFGAELGSPQPA